MHKSWEELTRVEQLQCEFSDFYKEVHGFRPHWPRSQWNDQAWLEAQITELAVESVEVFAAEGARQAAAVLKVEEDIATLLHTGAVDRAEAVRWMMDAEGAAGDADYLCFLLDVPYGYFNEEVA